jgi:hypothetical protein
VGLEVRVDRQDEVGDHDHEADGEQHVRRQPEADPDRGGGEGVHEVVEVVAVAGPLGPADAGEGAVERVTEPVHNQQGARRPEPGLVAVGEHVRGGDAERGQDPERREMVRHHPGRHAPGDPLEGAGLGLGEQELLGTRGIRGVRLRHRSLLC